jgi:hypothetical protein
VTCVTSAWPARPERSSTGSAGPIGRRSVGPYPDRRLQTTCASTPAASGLDRSVTVRRGVVLFPLR